MGRTWHDAGCKCSPHSATCSSRRWPQPAGARPTCAQVLTMSGAFTSAFSPPIAMSTQPIHSRSSFAAPARRPAFRHLAAPQQPARRALHAAHHHLPGGRPGLLCGTQREAESIQHISHNGWRADFVAVEQPTMHAARAPALLCCAQRELYQCCLEGSIVMLSSQQQFALPATCKCVWCMAYFVRPM